jgi:hypothetical protein
VPFSAWQLKGAEFSIQVLMGAAWTREPAGDWSVLSRNHTEPGASPMSSFSLYLIGFVIFITGLAYGAFLLGIATTWIAVGAFTLFGLGMVTGVSKTRTRDESPASD